MSSNEVQKKTSEQYKGGGQAADVIRRMMYALGISTQSALAETLGVRRAAVSDAKRQDRVPSEWLLKLCRLAGLNPAWLESGTGVMYVGGEKDNKEEGDYSAALSSAFEYIPMVEARLSGGGGSLETSEKVLGYYAFRREWLSRKGLIDSMRLMRVSGESMEPTLEDDDVVMVDLSQTDILAGKIYALRMDDEIVVKRLEKKPGKLVLVSDNRRYYEPLEINLMEYGNLGVLGRVVWMAREMI